MDDAVALCVAVLIVVGVAGPAAATSMVPDSTADVVGEADDPLRSFTQTSGDDSYEPNDDTENATALTDGEYQGLVAGAYDEDYYAVDVTEGEELAAAIQYDEGVADVDLDIYDDDGDFVTGSSDGDGAESIGTEVAAHDGPYYVVVEGGDENASYDLTIATGDNATATYAQRFEPNGGTSTATALSEGEYQGLIAEAYGDDYYAIDVTEGEELAAAIQYDEGVANVDLDIYDDDGDFVTGSSDGDGAESIGTEVAAHDGPYYVVVEAGETDAEYDMRIVTGDNATATYAQRFEPNGETSTATALTEGEYENLDAEAYEDDYYAIDVTEGEELAAAIQYDEGVADVDLDIYDADGDFVTGSSDGDGAESIGTEAIISGTYYVVVEAGETDAEYDMRIVTGDNATATYAQRFEPNGGTSTATVLPEGEYEGLVAEAYEDDYYAIDVTEGEELAATIQYDEGTADVDLDIYDDDGDFVTGSSDGDGTENVSTEATTTGTYYVLVDAGEETADYSLSIDAGQSEPTNEAPQASFESTPSEPTTGDTVTFDASTSSDTDGSVQSYAWDFDGDGTTDATGESASHTYGSAGTYTVELVVTDDSGATGTTSTTLTVADTATHTRTSSPTAASPDGATDDDTPADSNGQSDASDEETVSGSGPGFTPLTVLVALAATSLLLLRRRR